MFLSLKEGRGSIYTVCKCADTVRGEATRFASSEDRKVNKLVLRGGEWRCLKSPPSCTAK